METPQATFAEFLQSYSLYRKCELTDIRPSILRALVVPPLQFYCDACDQERTWFELLEMRHSVGASEDSPNHDRTASQLVNHDRLVMNTVVSLTYSCLGCQKSTKIFVIRFDLEGATPVATKDGPKLIPKGNGGITFFATKVGQFPRETIQPPSNVSKALGEHRVDYIKGAFCEQQGLGLAAFAYYRRIVEETIEKLLNDMDHVFVNEPKHAEYHAKLQEAKKLRAHSTKIELVQDLMPHSLFSCGRNPLAILHSALSAGLHAHSDEDCLTLAEAIRTALVIMVDAIDSQRKQNKAYDGSLSKITTLLDQIGKKTKKPDATA